MTFEVNDENFDEQVLKSSCPVMVDFWAPWCGPCRMVSPIVEKLSELEKYAGKFKFCKLNVDEGQKTATKYKVMAIPTLMFFRDGEVVDTVVGAMPESALQSRVDGFV